MKVNAGIILLPGMAGDLAGNVRRWLGQLGVDPVDETQLDAFLKQIEIIKTDLDPKAQLIDFRKWEDIADAEQNFLIAVLAYEGGQAFIKLTAPPAVLEKEQENLLKLCQSLHF